MKHKILSLFLLTAILLSVGIISATECLELTETSVPLEAYADDGELTINFALSNRGTCTAEKDLAWLITSNKDESGTWDTSSLPASIVMGDLEEPEELSATFTFDDTISLGDMTITVSVNDGDTDEFDLDLTPITILESATPEVEPFCEYGPIDNNELRVKVKIENIEGFGEEDDEWYPLDEIEVKIEVENRIEETVDDIIIEWGLYDPEEDYWIIDDEEDDFKLKKDKEKTVYLNFKLDPDDINEENDDYIFYVKVYSDDSLHYGEDKLCIEYSEPITIMRDDHFVILDDIQIPETVPCDTDIEITAKIWNIGEVEEEDVFVRMYNEKLGIDERVDIRDIDVFEDEKVSFNFRIPKDAEETGYYLEFSVFDEDNYIFENDNEDEAQFLRRIEVKGNCEVETEEPKITAELDSETPEAIAGKQVIIIATIENTGDETTTYTISVSGNSAWSTLSEIYPKEITLEAGESEDVSIMLNLDADAEGDKEFTIKADYDEQTTEQKVALSVESTTAGITGAVVGDHVRTNWFIYLIAIINIILIIAIIAVVKSMVGRTPAR